MNKPTEVPTDKSTVLDTIWVNHDVRYWQSHVRVVQRDVHHDDAIKSYINVELQVGTRWLAMPVWLVPAIVEALKDAQICAEHLAADIKQNPDAPETE